ncbi:MAG: helix-turn-helix domain-containing protein, partial [Chloroflexota bacterium]|nr:helix-turn-helix domain-containing protein [Chloroflexota bacterium]
MALTDQQLLDALSRMPFVESTELALILGEPHATVHRRLSELLAEGIVGKATHGTVHLPSSSMSIPRNIEPQYPLTLSQIP